MDDGPRASVRALVVAAGLLVLMGAGCSGNLSQDVSQSQAIASSDTSATSTPQVLPIRSCLTNSSHIDMAALSQWQGSQVYTYFSQQAGVKFAADFNDAIQKKLDEGWRFSVACNELSGPQLFFAMYNPATSTIPWLDKKQNGQPNIIGEYAEAYDADGLNNEGSFIEFSDPVGIPGKNGYGQIIDLQLQSDGLVNGLASRDTGKGTYADTLQLDEIDPNTLGAIKTTKKLTLKSSHWTQ
ncbi:MAG: hypothetical protein WA001_05240 [Patescibacteria group bacterium]